MKIVQSFWSLPAQNNAKDALNGRNCGGWPSERLHAMSWAFSISKLKQFYPEVVLYTDKTGKEWLIDKLNLPYTNVHKELDCLNTYNPLLWALPKIYTYAKQSEPFIHVDGDVYIWEKFSNKFENAELLVQNLEENYAYYKKPLKQIAEHFTYLPNLLQEALNAQSNQPLISINAGVIGGHNNNFFEELKTFAFDFITKNAVVISRVDAGDLNIVFEQLCCYLWAKNKNIPITTLLENVTVESADLIRFNTTPLLNKFIHVIGFAKQNPIACSQLERRLKYEFPEMYTHINALYPIEKITSIPLTVNKDYDIKEIFTNTNIILDKLTIDYKNIEFESLCDLIEVEYNKHSTENHYKLLSDIYQIEKYKYLTHKTLYSSPETFTKNIEEKTEKILRKLYEDNIDAFLSTKFTLDKNICQIAYLSYQYPNPITMEVIESIVTDKCTITESKNTQMVLIQSLGYNEKELYTKPLTSWNELLYYFDEEALTGNQLIDIIKKRNDFEYNGTQLKIDVLNFLSSNCLYFSYLKIVK
ncbi:DUF6734 family protein [Ferruginibacter sp. SUN002]|uniref:DUF6734 family protein n=1 Tax=Ferruginibacter sp. SUN002 TaxID=2937789 RepID=UPI003D36121D